MTALPAAPGPRRAPGHRLIATGAVVSVVGLAAATNALAIARYRTTFVVGVGLVALGALRRWMPGASGPRDGGCGW